MATPRTPAAIPPPVEIMEAIARLASMPEVRESYQWFASEEDTFSEWQTQLARIPAPPFGEAARSRWLMDRFCELKLEDVHTDEVGNVLGTRRGAAKPAKSAKNPARNHVALSAHIDTVFPAGTPLNVRKQGSRLHGPGISDNAAGVIALLAIAGALRKAKIPHAAPILFIGNVGEEGEGDLRGMRHIFSKSPCAASIRYSLVVDGAGCDTIVTEALGSRRYEVTLRGPGGHSWSDFGAPNPIQALARAIDAFSRAPVPSSPKTTFNIGVIQGGTSVNSIPESASMRVDIRSVSMGEIERLERALRQAMDEAIEHCAASAARGLTSGSKRHPPLKAEIRLIGSRPAGELDPESHMLRVVRAVDEHLDNSAHIQRASTDANIPLSLGRDALALGAGGSGGGAHTLQEWFDCKGRELGLRRILLTVLSLAGTEA
jgi:acetylornithine deacetylase/succinyl-diaminopimelate desuccinylase-like protein